MYLIYNYVLSLLQSLSSMAKSVTAKPQTQDKHILRLEV